MNEIIGSEGDIEWWQMGIRAFIVFFAAIVIVRVGDRRIFGKNAAIDIVLGIILGSVLSRAITGNAPFFPALFASVVLMVLHWVLAKMAFNSERFGWLVKGCEKQLIKDGVLLKDAMKSSQITENDLYEVVRQSKMEDLSKIKNAYIERNGNISLIPFEK